MMARYILKHPSGMWHVFRIFFPKKCISSLLADIEPKSEAVPGIMLETSSMTGTVAIPWDLDSQVIRCLHRLSHGLHDCFYAVQVGWCTALTSQSHFQSCNTQWLCILGHASGLCHHKFMSSCLPVVRGTQYLADVGAEAGIGSGSSISQLAFSGFKHAFNHLITIWTYEWMNEWIGRLFRWRLCQLRRMRMVVLTLMRRPMPTGSCRTSRGTLINSKSLNQTWSPLA